MESYVEISHTEFDNVEKTINLQEFYAKDDESIESDLNESDIKLPKLNLKTLIIDFSCINFLDSFGSKTLSQVKFINHVKCFCFKFYLPFFLLLR